MNPPAYDPATRSIPVDSGAIRQAHWVDASMAYCLTNAYGTIPGNRTVGVRRDKLRRATKLTAQSIVEDEVAAAIAHLTARNAVEILRIVAVWRLGVLGFLVQYRNLLAPTRRVGTYDVRTIEG